MYLWPVLDAGVSSKTPMIVVLRRFTAPDGVARITYTIEGQFAHCLILLSVDRLWTGTCGPTSVPEVDRLTIGCGRELPACFQLRKLPVTWTYL